MNPGHYKTNKFIPSHIIVKFQEKEKFIIVVRDMQIIKDKN